MEVSLIPNINKALSWLEAHPFVLSGIKRGIERETLRITPEGTIANTPHPVSLGAALTNKWITTDFAESLLEFITPVNTDIDHMFSFLHDIHCYVSRKLPDDQRIWPLSIPGCISHNQPIELANYGNSNIGKMKMVYREGLKNRYGALMQIISGVHYNFSLPLIFWQEREKITNIEEQREKISQGYLRLIRNYYRFGWVIPFLFGASPAICSSFLQNKSSNLPFETLPNGSIYLPYATTLRMSDLGYTNRSQSALGISFNTLEDYVRQLKHAIHTPSEDFARIGIKVNGKYRQLNSNILQIENEFYAPIRPKRVCQAGESPSDALLRGGIEYIEVRALDVNPFSPLGVDPNQVRFLDLFLIWCVLADAPEMSSDELTCCQRNWNRIILNGRKPGQTISLGCDTKRYPLSFVGHQLFTDLLRVAQVLDKQNNNDQYQSVCQTLSIAFDNPELTLSGQMLQAIKDMGQTNLGISLSEKYHQYLISSPLQILTEKQLDDEVHVSLQRQQELEESDTMNFDEFLKRNKI